MSLLFVFTAANISVQSKTGPYALLYETPLYLYSVISRPGLDPLKRRQLQLTPLAQAKLQAPPLQTNARI